MTYQEEQFKQSRMYTPLYAKQEPNHYPNRPPDGAKRPQQKDEMQQASHNLLQPQRRTSSNNVDSTISDLARFLAKSQLVTGGLTKFDNKPESYLSWKATFQTTTRDLGITASEEMNLLVKWLGPESSEHAKRLKAVNIKHPPAGLDMIWKRLEECYGSPEAIENSLFSRVQTFPKLSSKEPHKLRDLSDLLCELHAAKLDGYLPGLSYLDTARGVSQIVEKLPFHLQEKWTMVGTKFKEDHNVSFPPFSFFVEFVKGQAKARNDPSFTTIYLSPTHSTITCRKGKPTGNYTQKPSVTVHKIEVSEGGKTVEDIKRQCPIHHKPHPLKRCRGFRIMLLEDRKKLVKDNNICYHCLASTDHQAKDCKVTVKCEECNSEKHLAALHPGPAPSMSKPPSYPKEHGGEQANVQDLRCHRHMYRGMWK
ncbi:uncharacterized protein LOC130566840 [Triplophysa rosa]|uniref:uncharacterized protein LOC130566840 n=1 Tax=Triplophysa rosa TaxID=992332 RepID=UPI00254628B5|nr:uncharacterized protein LOC130566840 [Triplophysa rosa]